MTPQRKMPASTPLRDSPEQGVGLSLPIAISDRVDALVALTETAGDRTNRKELIASLILAAPALSDKLAAGLRRYRVATVRDALLDPETAHQNISVPVRRPGPRPRKRS